MKKKILTAVLSMVLCLGMTVSVMAASPNTGGGAIIKNPDGTSTAVEYTADSKQVYANANDAQKKALEAFDALVPAGTEDGTAQFEFVKKVSGMNITDWATPTVIDLKADITGPTKIVFWADGVKKGETVVVLHLKADGTWEPITATVDEDNYITGTFTSLSPVLWAKATLAAAPAPGPAAQPYAPGDYDKYLTNTADAPVSPKTADAAPVLPVLALACLAGVVVCSKKVKFN